MSGHVVVHLMPHTIQPEHNQFVRGWVEVGAADALHVGGGDGGDARGSAATATAVRRSALPLALRLALLLNATLFISAAPAKGERAFPDTATLANAVVNLVERLTASSIRTGERCLTTRARGEARGGRSLVPGPWPPTVC